MPRVVFTSHLARHLDCPEQNVQGASVREVLEVVFEKNAPLRGYVLDDQNHLRKHVVIFVDQQTIRDREQLSDPVTDRSEIYVMQALSGG